MELMQPFFEASEKRIQELADLRREGRKVIGFFCLHTPPVLIEAAGGIPVRLCPQGDSAVQRSGELFARNYICPFVKACLGHLATGHPWFVNIDAIAVGSTCDQMRHMADVWRSRFHIPAYVFFQPRGLDKPEAIWIYQRELRWLFQELRACCAGNYDQYTIQDAVDRHNSIQHYLFMLHQLRMAANPPITGAEWLTAVQAGFLLNSRIYLALLQRLYARLTREKGPRRTPPLRIMLAGGMLAQGDEQIVRIIEDAGRAVVVTDALCTGTRVMGCEIGGEGDLIANIIEAYRTKVPCIHARPNHLLYRYMERQIKQFGVEGVVFHTLKFCDGWGGEGLRMQQFLQERGIPSIVIDRDYGTADTGRITTRIEAFLELLEDKRSLTAKPPSRQG